MEEICRTCKFWVRDWGLHCMVGGWTGADRDQGHCHFEVERIVKMGYGFCSHWEPKPEGK